MTLEHTQHKSGSTAVKLTKCPGQDCEWTFGENEGEKRRQHLLNDHTPEDFNLD